MHRFARLFSAVMFGVAVGCQDRTVAPPSFAVTQPASACPANPTIIVTDDTLLRAALRAARPGDVIAVSGTIEVTRDDSITTDNVTLTCATPGSGLVAASFDSTGSQVADLITVTARGVVVDNLVLDGGNASDSPLFVVNDGETAFAQDVQFTHNDVTCARFGSCVFVAGGTGPVVSDNRFLATDAFTGVHLQANGPDPSVPFPTRIDGARVERNTLVATTPSLGPRFGAIRIFDADNVSVADNQISGPWRNGFSPFRLSHSQILRNQISGPVVDGIQTSNAAPGTPGQVSQTLFSSNQVTGAGRSGVFAHRACANRFTNNDLRGNTGSLGLALDDTTGANVVAGVENASVIDNGVFDCDGDGRTDPNIITGGVVHHQPMPPDTTSTPARKNGSILIL